MQDPLYLQQGEHSCKSLYICNKGNTHVRSSISAIRVALMQDPLYLQQGEHSCKILYICNKGSTHVRSSIYNMIRVNKWTALLG